MQAASLDELTANFEELGVKFRRQIAKKILRKGGAWASIAFTFQDLDGGEYGEPELMLATFKSVGGIYKRYNYYIIKNKKEIEDIWELL